MYICRYIKFKTRGPNSLHINISSTQFSRISLGGTVTRPGINTCPESGWCENVTVDELCIIKCSRNINLKSSLSLQFFCQSYWVHACIFGKNDTALFRLSDLQRCSLLIATLLSFTLTNIHICYWSIYKSCSTRLGIVLFYKSNLSQYIWCI